MDKEHPEVIECDTDSDPEEFSDAVEKPTDECEDPADKFFDVDWKESKEGESAEDDDKSTNTPSAQDLAEQRLKERMEIEEKMTENEKQVSLKSILKPYLALGVAYDFFSLDQA